MRRVLRWLGILLGALVGIILVAALAIFLISNGKLSESFTKPATTLVAPTDTETIARGEYLANTLGCTECHGENLGGTVFLNDPAMGVLSAPNLTRGGVGATYSDADYDTALRYGMRPDGTTLLIMPSDHYYYLNDADTAAIIAYLKSVPPVDNNPGARQPGPILRMLLATDQFPRAAAIVAANPPRPAPVPQGATVEHGGYLANQCIGCHGMNLKGGFAQGEGGAQIPTPDITGHGRLADYTQEQFLALFRTGTRPDGSQISPAMPWQTIGNATDDDLAALYLHLAQLPPRRAHRPRAIEAGHRNGKRRRTS